MLKHKCPKCGKDVGYKWNYSIYSKGYQCPNCKTQLETSFVLTITVFLSLFIGLILTDYITPFVTFGNMNPQLVKGVTTFVTIILVWFVLSTLLPIKLRIRKKTSKTNKSNKVNKASKSK